MNFVQGAENRKEDFGLRTLNTVREWKVHVFILWTDTWTENDRISDGTELYQLTEETAPGVLVNLRKGSFYLEVLYFSFQKLSAWLKCIAQFSGIKL